MMWFPPFTILVLIVFVAAVLAAIAAVLAALAAVLCILVFLGFAIVACILICKRKMDGIVTVVRSHLEVARRAYLTSRVRTCP
jgi:hypothetical protein